MADPAMTVSSERVERVARALAAHEYERDNGHPMPSDFAGPDYQWVDWVPDARAAIESLSITEGEVEQRARELLAAEYDALATRLEWQVHRASEAIDCRHHAVDLRAGRTHGDEAALNAIKAALSSLPVSVL